MKIKIFLIPIVVLFSFTTLSAQKKSGHKAAAASTTIVPDLKTTVVAKDKKEIICDVNRSVRCEVNLVPGGYTIFFKRPVVEFPTDASEKRKYEQSLIVKKFLAGKIDNRISDITSEEIAKTGIKQAAESVTFEESANENNGAGKEILKDVRLTVLVDENKTMLQKKGDENLLPVDLPDGIYPLIVSWMASEPRSANFLLTFKGGNCVAVDLKK